MSGFKEMAARATHKVFLNTNHFAEKRTVRYGYDDDGVYQEEYRDIPIVLSGMKEQDRRQMVSDHAEGLFLVSAVLHCAKDDLGGKQPEKGCRISINDEEGGGGFFREFYIASSTCELGMLRVELEAIDQ